MPHDRLPQLYEQLTERLRSAACRREAEDRPRPVSRTTDRPRSAADIAISLQTAARGAGAVG